MHIFDKYLNAPRWGVLTKHKLTKSELILPRKDPKFTPTAKINILSSKKDTLNFTGRLQLKE